MATSIWVWVKLEGDIRNHFRASLTTRREEATVLSGPDSNDLVRAVAEEYANYNWLSVPVVGRGRYVVEGMQIESAAAPTDAA
jgi:hypothetical protein